MLKDSSNHSDLKVEIVEPGNHHPCCPVVKPPELQRDMTPQDVFYGGLDIGLPHLITPPLFLENSAPLINFPSCAVQRYRLLIKSLDIEWRVWRKRRVGGGVQD
ncbi:hypothetical protein J6590_012245 [Homalodisca vitripennis]|nr:hypothetical protein J6590_012245 [Homalodisca vitripennis]